MTPETRKELLLGSTILAVITLSTIAIPIAIDRLNNDVHAPKYAIQTGNLIVDYMSANEGRWPNDWENLRRDVPKDRRAWFDEVQENVDIDFDWEPTSIDISIDRHLEGVPMKPISLKNGKVLDHQAYPDPNFIIFDYLKRTAKPEGSK